MKKMKTTDRVRAAGGTFAGGEPTVAELREQRSGAVRDLHAVAAELAGLGTDATPERVAEVEARMTTAEGVVTGIDAAIARIERVERARELAPLPEGAEPPAAGDTRSGGTAVAVTREPGVYDRWNVRTSYLHDLACANPSFGSDRQADAVERLRRHSQVERARYEAREAQLAVEHERAMTETLRQLPPTLRWAYEQQIEAGQYRFAERRDISRTDGAGGEFVPPLWMVDDFVALARAGRTTADLVRQAPLPSGTDSINIPKIATGTAVAVQASDNAAVQETDLTTSSVNAPVQTIAGQQDVALQLLEQSPIAFDQLIFQDLTADYALKLDVQVISGTGASGTLEGFLNADTINTVTYTDATPTVPELWPKLADALNQAQTGRRLPAEAIVMHPRRWYWMVAALGSDNRPLITIFPPTYSNSMGVMERNANEGPVGAIMGLPVFLDPSLPTNLGAGTNEDVILISRFSDSWLFEGALRTRVLPEVLSGTLTVRLQAYAYVAFTAERYPTATSQVTGTGLITPTF